MKRLLVSGRVRAGGDASRLFARVPATGVAILAAAVILLVGAPAVYAATTLYVNAATGTDSPACGASTSPCRTIQQAVDNASDGDTIQVAAGAYPAEPPSYYDRLVIDKSVTLDGAQAGNAGSAARAASPTGESVIGEHVDVEASNVTLDGFSFDLPGTQLFVNGPTGTAIENDVFTGYEPDNYTAYQITSAIGVNAAPGTAITRNYFTSPGSTDGAVQFFNGGCSDTVVSDNTFYAAANDGLATIFFYCDNQPSADITVSGNNDVHVGDTNGESTLVAEAVAGDIHVTGNKVTDSSYGSSGFYFTLSPNLGAVDISGNSVVGSVSSAITIRPTGGGTGSYTITGNRLAGGKYGVYVYAGALASGATVTLHGNDLSGNSGYGVYNSDPTYGGSIDATKNWWGCNGGPVASGCSAVSGVPTFDPWLVLGISASPNTLQAGDSATVTADVTHDSAGNDTSASATIPDGTSIGFATDLGILSASSAGTSAGKASVTLTSSAPGTAHVSATLDSGTASTDVTFTPATPTSANQCKNGGWQSYRIFKNQGDCVSYVATHGKNPPGK
jgi:hypothetical protein